MYKDFIKIFLILPPHPPALLLPLTFFPFPRGGRVGDEGLLADGNPFFIFDFKDFTNFRLNANYSYLLSSKKHRMKRISKIALVMLSVMLSAAGPVLGQNKTIADTMMIYFREIRANTNHYHDLWNVDLYGPVLLVNPASRAVYSNFPDSAGILKPFGKIFSGKLPVNVNIANTATRCLLKDTAQFIRI